MASFNLLQGFQSLITPDFIGKASGVIGESPENTRSSLKGAVPALLMGVVNRGSSLEGANGLLQMIRDDGYDQGVPHNYVDRLSGGANTDRYMRKGGDVLNHVFGPQLGSVTGRISALTGGDPGKSTRLLSLLAPMAMGVLGSVVKKRGLDGAGLSSLLSDQKRHLSAALPAGMGMEEAPHYEERGEERIRRISAADLEEGRYRPEPHRKKRSMALPLALAAILALGLFFFLRDRGQRPEIPAPEQAGRIEKPAAPVAPKAKIPAVTTEAGNQLATAVAPGSKVALPERIPLDSVRFPPGKTELSASSDKEIGEVAEVLKSDPSAKIRVEGLADPSGDPSKNQELSTERAKSVQKALTDKGVQPQQLTIIGLGEQPSEPSARAGGEESRRVILLLTQR